MSIVKLHIQSISTTHFRCTIFAFSFISLLHWELCCCCCCCYCAESQRHFNKSIDLRGPSLNFNVHRHIFATSFFSLRLHFGCIWTQSFIRCEWNQPKLCIFVSALHRNKYFRLIAHWESSRAMIIVKRLCIWNNDKMHRHRHRHRHTMCTVHGAESRYSNNWESVICDLI